MGMASQEESVSSNVVEKANSTNSNKTRKQKASSGQLTPRGYWGDPDNRRRFFDRVGQELGVKTLDDWYHVSTADLYKRGGASLVKYHFRGSMLQALRSIYPEHPWNALRFAKASHKYWADKAHQRQLFDEIARDLGIDAAQQQPDGWYRVRTEDILALGRKGVNTVLTNYYRGSLRRALQEIYPEYEWDAERFAVASHGYWKDLRRQRQFFDRVGKELGIVALEDWYRHKAEDVISRGGSAFMGYYSSSLQQALMAVYPEYPWDATKFPTVMRGHWKSIHNQRRFFDKVAAELGLETLDDWYCVTVEEVKAKGGGGLMAHYYSNSLARALPAIYPEHTWHPWKFSSPVASLYLTSATMVHSHNHNHSHSSTSLSSSSSSPSSTPSSPPGVGAPSESAESASTSASVSADSMLRGCIEALSQELGISKLDDWYRVSAAEFRASSSGGYSMVVRSGGLPFVLKKLYPHHDWDVTKFTASKKKSSQRSLLHAVKRLFPAYPIRETTNSIPKNK